MGKITGNGTCCHCTRLAITTSSHPNSLKSLVPLLILQVTTEEQKAERSVLSLQKTKLRKNHSKDRNLWSALPFREPEQWVSLSKDYQAARTEKLLFSLIKVGRDRGQRWEDSCSWPFQNIWRAWPQESEKGKGPYFGWNVSFSTNPYVEIPLVLGPRTSGRS